MGEIFSVKIVPNGGINTFDSKTDLKLGETNDALNGYYDRGYRKRPGLKKTNTTAMANHIIHMARHAMAHQSVANQPIRDGIYALFFDTTEVRVGFLDIEAATFTDKVAVFGVTHGSSDDDMELVPAGTNMIFVTANRDIGEPTKIEATGGAGSIALISSNNSMQNAFKSAVWHRDHLFGTHSTAVSEAHNVGFSAFNDPRSFPAANLFTVRPLGRIDEATGLVSANDILYIYKARSIWVLTGAAEELFRLERIASGIGAYSSLGSAVVEGKIIGLAAIVGWMGADPGENERTYPSNVFAISGFTVQVIGNKIKSFLEALYADQIVTDSVDRKFMRSVYWEDRGLVILFPKIPFDASATSEAEVLDVRRSTDNPVWWRWTFGTTVLPNAPVYHNRKVFVGCGDGRIREFDDSVADDDGDTFDSYVTTGWISHPNKNRIIATERLEIDGEQISGGVTNIFVAVDDGAFPATAQKTVALPTSGSKITLVDMSGITNKKGKVVNIKFQYPTDGVGCVIRSVTPDFKVLGAAE